MPLESVLRPPDDPREALDYSYQRQLEALQKVRRGVAEVATSRKRVELQADQLEQAAAGFARQGQDALGTGQEDLASDARSREAAAREQLLVLRRQLSVLLGEEQRITAASQRLQAKVDAFRTRKETIKAIYTADEASRTVGEAFAGIGEDTGDLEVIDAGAEAFSEAGSAPAEVSKVPEEPRVLAPPGVMELRPGAPDQVQVGLLFVMEPQHGAVLVAWVEDPGQSPDAYQEVIPAVTARLAMAQSGPPEAGASPGAFTSYDAESFLDEFFPGEGAEVEIGAAALVARNRAHTLAQARQRLKLTQAQVASRMNIRLERVAAIERAEPGATEVRTLAAYVQALGGRLEIIAEIGGERIMLK
ncbi:MAG: PspA/IM30 family protein [Streptosporangiaceae bacterium]